MKELTNISSIAIDKYFNTLSKLGYRNYDSVSKLLILLFIEEILDSPEYSFYITEDDYKVITNALYCLYGNDCMIDIPKNYVQDSIIHPTKTHRIFRISEEDILRLNMGNKIKVEA